jgi:hypothetical protein
MLRTLLAFLVASLLPMRTAVAAPAPSEALPNAQQLRKLNARFVPVDLVADVSKLPENERRALARMIEAARIMDPLFLRQAWSGNEPLLFELLDDSSELGRARLDAFLLHKGPWDRLEHNQRFLPGAPEKPAQANFYSAKDKAEVEAWVKSLPEAERARATGFFTTLRRDPKGKLTAVPYGIEYQGDLQRAAALLREAAGLTAQPTLKRFLETRAEAFLSNDYYASDVAWMELDASIEPTIGPYEVYEDEWFNQKAAFEAFITLRDDAETRKLTRLSGELQDLENHLPIDPRHRNPKLGALAPIRVVNSIFSSGDGNRGVQTAAYNLPNDERIAQEKGTKRVMLKNVQEAKYQKVLVPIARVALSKADQRDLDFDAFFTFILMHELMHGLGPHDIQVAGRQTTVRQEFQDAYSAVEEAKADISGLWALQQLVDKGVLDKKLARTMYDTFLASMFRSVRFGITEAHGRGVALQLNFLLDAGGIEARPDGTFAIVEGKIKKAVEDLTRELMTLQAKGDRASAKAMLERLAVVRPEVKKVLARLQNVPVDIRPRFVTAERVLSEARRAEMRTQR